MIDGELPESPQPPPQQDPVFWGWHDLFLFIFITLVSLFLAMAAGWGLRAWLHLSKSQMNFVFVLGQFIAYGIAFLCLKTMFMAQYGEPLLPSLRWVAIDAEPLRLAIIGLAQALVIGILGTLMRLRNQDTPMNELLADRPTAILIAVLGVTIAPMAEELAFRGLLQPLFVRTLGVAPGILLTSFLFGAMHFEQYGAWQSVVLITLAGAGFGVMRHRTGSSRASAYMHAGYNSTLFLLFFAQKAGGH